MVRDEGRQHLAVFANDRHASLSDELDPIRVAAVEDRIVLYREILGQPLGRGEWVIGLGRDDEHRISVDGTSLAPVLEQDEEKLQHSFSAEQHKWLWLKGIAGAKGTYARLWDAVGHPVVDGIIDGRALTYRTPQTVPYVGFNWRLTASSNGGFAIEGRGQPQWQSLGWRADLSSAMDTDSVFQRRAPRFTDPNIDPEPRCTEHNDSCFPEREGLVSCAVGPDGPTAAASRRVIHRKTALFNLVTHVEQEQEEVNVVYKGEKVIRVFPDR